MLHPVGFLCETTYARGGPFIIIIIARIFSSAERGGWVALACDAFCWASSVEHEWVNYIVIMV